MRHAFYACAGLGRSGWEEARGAGEWREASARGQRCGRAVGLSALKQITFKFSLAELLISSVHVHYNLYDMLYMLNNSFILLATTTDRQVETMECHMRIISFSDARSSLRTVIDQVVEDADVTVISRRDAPDAVVMSFDHYSSLMETVHLLSSPANAAHLAKSIGQARAGQAQHRDIVNIPEIEDLEHAQHKVHG